MNPKFLPASLFPAAVLLVLAAVVTQSSARSTEPEKTAAPNKAAAVDKPATAEKTVVIVGNDTLKFNVTKIEATPGQPIHVQLRNEGTLPKDGMGHNWILLDGDNEAVPYAMAAISARDVSYMPKALAEHVLAFIPLLGPKEVGNVSFKAPEKPGMYPFICSCSGAACRRYSGC